MAESWFEDRLKYILANNVPTDVTFVVGNGSCKEFNEEFTAHRIVLMMRSLVFKAMLQRLYHVALPHKITDEIPADGPIKVTDVTPAAFRELLAYCYETDDSKAAKAQPCWRNPREVFDIYFAANKYMVEGLKQNCLSFLKPQITKSVGRAYSILPFAYQYDLDGWKESCYVELAKHATTVIGGYFDFPGVTAHYLEEILRRVPAYAFRRYNYDKVVCSICKIRLVCETHYHPTNESYLFTALMEWADRQCDLQKLPASPENLRNVLGKNLYAVHYLAMNEKEFIDGPGASGIFTDEEKFAIVANINKPNSCPLPGSVGVIPSDVEKWKNVRKVFQCAVCMGKEGSRSSSLAVPHMNSLCYLTIEDQDA